MKEVGQNPCFVIQFFSGRQDYSSKVIARLRFV